MDKILKIKFEKSQFILRKNSYIHHLLTFRYSLYKALDFCASIPKILLRLISGVNLKAGGTNFMISLVFFSGRVKLYFSTILS